MYENVFFSSVCLPVCVCVYFNYSKNLIFCHATQRYREPCCLYRYNNHEQGLFKSGQAAGAIFFSHFREIFYAFIGMRTNTNEPPHKIKLLLAARSKKYTAHKPLHENRKTGSECQNVFLRYSLRVKSVWASSCTFQCSPKSCFKRHVVVVLEKKNY